MFNGHAAGAAVLGFAPSLTRAHPHIADFGVGVVVDPQVCPQPCDAVVVDHVDRVWVPATYRTVCERVWVAPVTEDREVHTWVPDRYELQEVEYREGHHHYIRQEQVLVEPAHDVCERQQVIVTPGHFEDMQRQELVCAGHYEDCGAPIVVERHPVARIDILGGWLHVR